MINKGYQPKDAQVRFIVYWQKQDSEEEIKIVLPEVHLEKAGDLKYGALQENQWFDSQKFDARIP